MIMSDDRGVGTGALALVAGCALVLAACGGKEKPADTTASAPATPAPAPSPGAAAAAPASAPGALAAPAPGAAPPGATPQELALGDSIFHGLAAGGICFTCHGADAKGTALAPPLTGPRKWLTGDGSFDFIQKRVTDGMPNPTPPYPGPMLPKGGANLTPAQIKAVSAYVYSISR
jgi:mono/diheme cytochrome c family protein